MGEIPLQRISFIFRQKHIQNRVTGWAEFFASWAREKFWGSFVWKITAIILLLFHGKSDVIILTKWVRLHAGRFLHKIIWSL
jgi:hypothetical protein